MGFLHADAVMLEFSNDDHSARLREYCFAILVVERDRSPRLFDAAFASVFVQEYLEHLANVRQTPDWPHRSAGYLVICEKASLFEFEICKTSVCAFGNARGRAPTRIKLLIAAGSRWRLCAA